MDYNTRRPALILPEYGRNVHQMVNFLKTIEDRDERNEQAKIVIDVMSALIPQIKNKEEMAQRLWTQLMIIAEFDLDVDLPVDIPNQETIFEKPQAIAYPKNKIKVRYYGHNIHLLLKEIDRYEGDELYQYVEQILNQMKKLYLNFNRDLVNDDVILKDFRRMSGKDFDFLDKIELAEYKVPKFVPKKRKSTQRKR